MSTAPQLQFEYADTPLHDEHYFELRAGPLGGHTRCIEILSFTSLQYTAGGVQRGDRKWSREFTFDTAGIMRQWVEFSLTDGVENASTIAITADCQATHIHWSRYRGSDYGPQLLHAMLAAHELSESREHLYWTIDGVAKTHEEIVQRPMSHRPIEHRLSCGTRRCGVQRKSALPPHEEASCFALTGLGHQPGGFVDYGHEFAGGPCTCGAE